MQLFRDCVTVLCTPSRNTLGFCGGTCTSSLIPPFAQSNNLLSLRIGLAPIITHRRISRQFLVERAGVLLKLHNDTKCILRVAPRLTLCMQDSEWLRFPERCTLPLVFSSKEKSPLNKTKVDCPYSVSRTILTPHHLTFGFAEFGTRPPKRGHWGFPPRLQHKTSTRARMGGVAVLFVKLSAHMKL